LINSTATSKENKCDFSVVQLNNHERLKWKGNVLRGDLNCKYILSKCTSDIYVDGLCIISIKNVIMKSRDFVHLYLFIAALHNLNLTITKSAK